jgi:hypothetical protein
MTASMADMISIKQGRACRMQRWRGVGVWLRPLCVRLLGEMGSRASAAAYAWVKKFGRGTA